jgi:hypothetical protein
VVSEIMSRAIEIVVGVDMRASRAVGLSGLGCEVVRLELLY